MSEITQTFVVQPNNINITVDNTTIEFTPSDVALNVYAGGIAQVNGTSGQLQYNNGGILGGVPNTDYNGTILSLGSTTDISISGGSANYVLTTNGSGALSWAPAQAASSNALNANIANVHIYGGVNGYVLQTDGTGNLTWTAQIGGTPGNGSPGGSNSQIQFNNAGNFGGVVGTSYDGANFTLGNISNVKLNGGNAGQFVVTNGNGNLAFANSTTGTGWNSVANIAVNDIFLGKLFGNVNAISPGTTVTTNANIDVNNWTLASNAGLSANGITTLIAGNTFMIGATTGTFGTGESNIYQTQTGLTWIATSTPFPVTNVVQANNNIVIYRSGTNNSAYSNNQGNTWTYANNINTTLNLRDAAFGNGTIIITRSENTSNNFIKSHDLGLTWSNSNIGSNTFGFSSIAYGNGKFIAIPTGGSSLAKRTTDNGNTWANINLTNTYLWRQIAYGNNKWVAVSEYTGATNRGSATVSSDDGNTWTTTLLGNVTWEGVAYANGIFVISNFSDANIRTSVDGITWSANINSNYTPVGGGQIAFNENLNLLTVAGISNNSASTLTPKIVITSSDGNSSNGQTTPAGDYKNLGGIGGNVGAMWVKTA